MPTLLIVEDEAAIAQYAWPGNVREIANAMERVVLFSDNDPVRAEDVGVTAAAAATVHVAAVPSGEIQIDFPDSGVSPEAVERALLMRALEKSAGNHSAAARLLGVSRDTLRYRMEKFGLGE